MTDEERRLHPLSWAFATAKHAQGYIVPWILVLFASGGSNYELWASLFVIPATIGAVLQYVVFRYRLADDEMVVRDGVLFRNERHIPYSRIQNIDLVRNPFHRLLDVALVRVETSSGGKPEAILRVLSMDAIETMRARVFADRPERREAAVAAESELAGTAAGASSVAAGLDAADPDLRRGGGSGAGALGAASERGDGTLLEVPTGEIVKLGIVSNQGLVVVGAALGLLWQQTSFGWMDSIQENVGAAGEWVAAVSGSPLLSGAVAVVAFVLLALVVLRVFSIGWHLMHLHGFRLRRRGDDLHTEYGLFNRVSRTIPTARIQLLETSEQPLHRWFRRQSVKLQTIGGPGADDVDMDETGSKAQSQWLAPMVETKQVPTLLRQVLDEVSLDDAEWRPVEWRAWRRIFKRWLALTAWLVLLGVWLAGTWVLALGAGMAVWAYAHARLTIRHTAYALTPWGLASRSGWWHRKTKVVRYSKIQTVASTESPFDRRHGMASVLVDTAGAGQVVHSVDIPYLDATVAEEVTRRLYAEAGRRDFHV